MDTALQDELQETLGDAYAIERELGGGGMSRVFLAVERSLSRRVVIKVLPPELVSGVSEARFQREIMLTANLQHPHILPVLTAGARGDILYYVTPYVEGSSLRERLTLDGPLPVHDALSILREVAGALAQAHARGVVHRDIKPENILLSGGHAVLSDFGIARALQQVATGERLTGTGLGIGTPGYMAPEQLAGDPTVDARADVFALGVVAYEMLAGRQPYMGPTPHALATAYFSDPPPPLQSLRADVSRALAHAVHKALASSPAERFATAGELLQALPMPTDPHMRVGMAKRRRRRRTALVFFTLAGLLAGGFLARFFFTPRAAEGEPAGWKTLAVLPFKNLGPPEDAYFADGVTEELTSRLAGLSGLGVISRTSADQYRQSTKTLREIARELHADYILEGSVRWEHGGDGKGRVRVTPQLIRVRDDSHLWSDRFDADLSDVFGVQSQIAERVAGALTVTLADPERRRMDARPTENLEAYSAYMRGERLRTHEAMSPASVAQASMLLDQATRLDPRFALAYAKRALADQELYDGYYDHTEQRLAAAGRAADSALALDPTLPEAHLALGVHFESAGDFDRAASEFAIAERGRPNDSYILSHTSALLARRGRWAEAVGKVRRAADLDPRSVEANVSAAGALMFTRDYAAALNYADRAFAADSNAIDAYVAKVRVQMLLGESARAAETARAALRHFGPDRVAGTDGFDEAIRVLDTTSLVMLARVPASAFANNRVGYLYSRVLLYRLWRPELARVYADSLLVAGAPLLKTGQADARLHAIVGWLNALAGRKEAAISSAQVARELMPPTRDALAWSDVLLMNAVTYALVGSRDESVALLEQALDAPTTVSVASLRTDPLWTPLRGYPRFEQLLARRR